MAGRIRVTLIVVKENGENTCTELNMISISMK